MQKRTLILTHMALLSVMILSFYSCDKNTVVPAMPMLHENLTLSEPTLWLAANSPHTIRGQLTVHNTMLTIEPGTIIRMDMGARIVVRGDMGAIIAEGTPDKGILITSSAANPEPGNWEHIDINGTSVVSSFSFCIIEYGGKNTSRGMLNISNGRVRVHHSTLAHSLNTEVKIDNDRGFDGFSNNTLTSVNGDAIFMRGRLAHSIEGGNAFRVLQGSGIRHCEIHDSKHFGVYRKKRLGVWGEPLLEDNHIHNNTSGNVGQDSWFAAIGF